MQNSTCASARHVSTLRHTRRAWLATHELVGALCARQLLDQRGGWGVREIIATAVLQQPLQNRRRTRALIRAGGRGNLGSLAVERAKRVRGWCRSAPFRLDSFPQVRGGSREAPTQSVRRAKPRRAARGTAWFGAPCLERGRPFKARGAVQWHNKRTAHARVVERSITRAWALRRCTGG